MKEQFKGIVEVESFHIAVDQKSTLQKRKVEAIDPKTNIRRPAYEITTVELKRPVDGQTNPGG